MANELEGTHACLEVVANHCIVQTATGQLLQVRVEGERCDGVLVAEKGAFERRVRLLLKNNAGGCVGGSVGGNISATMAIPVEESERVSEKCRVPLVLLPARPLTIDCIMSGTIWNRSSNYSRHCLYVTLCLY